MRNNRRMKRKDKTGITDKIITYSIVGIVSITIVLAGMLAYSKKIRDDMKNSTLELQEISNIAKEEQKKTTDVNSSMGKTVEDSKKNNKEAEEKNKNKEKELVNKKTENEDKSKITTTDKKKEISKTKNNNNNNENKENVKNKVKDNSKVNVVANPNKEKESKEPTKELAFVKPVEGEIMKEFAKDKLIYSETLKEWITHLGVDIKAEKTTVVKCAEEGRVKAIKNDPRYGLTIIVEHPNGYKTVYANLLSSEFVVENEKVAKGQSLGTVGNTAAFESANEPHLHFEILKDSQNVDPMAYIK